MSDLATFSTVQLEARAGEAAELLRALGNERRLMILCRLGAGECSAGELQGLVGLSQSALSQHLSVLRHAGILAARREGTAVFYRISDPAAVRVIVTLGEIFCTQNRTRCDERSTNPA
jgi:ArsR family transcriptional regulator